MIFRFAIATVLIGCTPFVGGKQQHLRRPQRSELQSSQQLHRSLQEKWTTAQKRLYERDQRRRFTNPDRTQAEEDAERVQMHEQGLIDPRRDPYNRMFGDHEYAYYREKRFQEDCRLYGINCNVHALDWDAADKRYDYDWIHDEHYLGTPKDPYPHDTTHKAYDPSYYHIDYGPYPVVNGPYGVMNNPTIADVTTATTTNNKNIRDSRYAQQHAQEHLRNCRRYGTDCDKFTLMQLNEGDPGVRCTGTRCSVNENLFTIADVTPADSNINNTTYISDSKNTQRIIEQHRRDCRLFGVNCDVAALENDKIGYSNEHTSAFPYDHEVYDYYQNHVGN